MARLAFRFAMTSPRVTAAAVEAASFPGLSARYGVRAVPHTVINDKEAVVGAVPEAAFLKAIAKAAGPGGDAAAN